MYSGKQLSILVLEGIAYIVITSLVFKGTNFRPLEMYVTTVHFFPPPSRGVAGIKTILLVILIDPNNNN